MDISLVKGGMGLRGGFDGAFGILVGSITLGTILLCCILGGISSVDRILLGRIQQGTVWQKSDFARDSFGGNDLVEKGPTRHGLGKEIVGGENAVAVVEPGESKVNSCQVCMRRGFLSFGLVRKVNNELNC
jgi:hypothetical protein